MSVSSHGASKSWSRRVKAALVIAASLIAGCNNIFSEFANREDDAALYQTALNGLNTANYDLAVDACQSMSAGFLAGEGAFVCASAYAGRCGYDMRSAVDQLTNFSGTPLLLEYAMEQYNGATTDDMADCDTALQLLRGIGPADARSDDQNFMIILSSLTHLGVILNTLADTDDDGTPDPAWDAGDPADMTNAQKVQFGRALWEMYRSAEAVDSDITDDVRTALDAISDAIDLIDPSFNFLDADSDPDNFTADELRGICALIKDGAALGLSYCANFGACLATCP